MKDISIIFSKRTQFNLFSQAIMWGLKTPYSHVAVKMVDGDTKQVVYYQASGLNINCISEKDFLAVETVVCEKKVQCSDNVFVKGKAFAIDQLGKPYSILAILGFALQILLGMVHIKIGNPFKADGQQYVCSQFAGAYIEECDNIDLDITNMTPLALYEAIHNLPDVWS
jgi:hypothetical protein